MTDLSFLPFDFIEPHFEIKLLLHTVLVNTFWREGKTEEAVLAVKDMERRGIVGSAALYYDLARCLCTSGRCQEALDLVIFLCLMYDVSVVHVYFKTESKEHYILAKQSAFIKWCVAN